MRELVKCFHNFYKTQLNDIIRKIIRGLIALKDNCFSRFCSFDKRSLITFHSEVKKGINVVG